jgi:hypothetical protein
VQEVLKRFREPTDFSWVSKTYRVDIGRNYRALGVKPQHEDTIYWYFIGTHEDYNEEIKNAK